MTTNPYESPETVGSPRRRTINLATLGLRLLLAVGVLGILVILLLPATRFGSRESARRFHCGNNLHQIALALRKYESSYHCLPPACTVDAAGKPLHSWRTLILPYIEQKALYDRIDLSKPWDDPVNQVASAIGPSVYTCPSFHASKSRTTYLAVVAPGGCFQKTTPRTLAEITDKPGSTLMVIEVSDDHAVPWMSPSDASEELILKLTSDKKSAHSNGAMAAFVDGSVHLLSRNTTPAVLRALTSIAGNDDASAEAVD